MRLDRGRRAEHGRRVRAILDRAGLSSVGIFASGRLARHDLAELIAQGPPVDRFGVGSRLDTSADAPYLDCACKIQDYAADAQRAGRIRDHAAPTRRCFPWRPFVFLRVRDTGLVRRGHR